MDSENASAMLTLGGGLALLTATLVYMWALGDPMVMYLMLATGIMAVFPTYRPIVAAMSLYSVYRISVRHDPVTGDFTSFVSAVAEAISTTVGGTAFVVTVMAVIPALKAALSFDMGAVKAALVEAIPLLTLGVVNYFVEAQADADLTQLVMGGFDHLRSLGKILRSVLGLFSS
eukprot:jgi/Tetstr1/464236/TSEL_009041.t1